MKTCTTCHRLYPDDAGFCPVEGQKLASTDEVSPPPNPKDDRVGAVVCDRYRIWRVVAEGGMGRVYEALDREENRGVALKILHREVSQDAVALERFKREFQVSAVLPHEHVVEVLAFERDAAGSYVLVMEYLEGEELRMLMRRQKVLPPERVIRILAQLAIGLAAAHERKIVHRDLKPDNVFLCGTRDGDLVKILDFGSVRDNSAGAKKLTAVGTTIGSPFYMAPEQAQGLAELDHRADVWSIAAITYEALTGKLPFEGNNGPNILLAIMTKPHKPPSEVGKAHGVPRTLDVVMEEALAKEPAHRLGAVSVLADRVGHAYGLEGTHLDWANVPEAELGERIRQGLPEALSRLEEAHGGASDLAAMDAAFAAGPSTSPSAENAFPDDVVMGIPTERPRWIIAVIVLLVVVVGVVVALVVGRP